MAIIRTKDLKVKYYPLENGSGNIEMNYGEYLAKDNKIMLANVQENKTFYTLEFSGNNDA